MKTIKDFISVVDLQTLIVSILALGSTYACLRFGLLAEIPTGLIGLAVVFPIVFSINAAYKRREEALKYFGELKAHSVALYYAHRDWVPGDAGGESGHSKRVRQLIEDLFLGVGRDLRDKDRTAKSLAEVYAIFSRFSAANEALRVAKVPANEVSRANQYISKIMTDYERMRNIASYRTPVSLRAYSSVFLNLFPVAFGPYFAMLCVKSESFPQVGYIVALLYSLVLVTLDNLQEDLEDPFDGIGTDDVNLDVIADYQGVLAKDATDT